MVLLEAIRENDSAKLEQFQDQAKDWPFVKDILRETISRANIETMNALIIFLVKYSQKPFQVIISVVKVVELKKVILYLTN